MVQPYSIYIHIPFCRARCKYCAFSSNVDFGLQQAYFDKLCSEIATAYAPVTDIKTLFVGGGTPTSVDGRYLMQVFDAVRKRFRLADDCEITYAHSYNRYVVAAYAPVDVCVGNLSRYTDVANPR